MLLFCVQTYLQSHLFSPFPRVFLSSLVVGLGKLLRSSHSSKLCGSFLRSKKAPPAASRTTIRPQHPQLRWWRRRRRRRRRLAGDGGDADCSSGSAPQAVGERNSEVYGECRCRSGCFCWQQQQQQQQQRWQFGERERLRVFRYVSHRGMARKTGAAARTAAAMMANDCDIVLTSYSTLEKDPTLLSARALVTHLPR